MARGDAGSICVAYTFSCQDAPCTWYGGECFAGFYCKLGADGLSGTCQAMPKTGGVCDDQTSYACATGLSCNVDLDGGAATCGALGSAGATCLSIANCATGLYCLKPDGGVVGTCTATIAAGGDCNPNDRNFACGRYFDNCQPVTRKCGANPKLSENCSVAEQNCQNGWCEASGDAGLGVCVAKLAGGAPCASRGQCESGYCLLPAAGGDAGTACMAVCKRP
jgi:hypothetical protein